MKKLLNILLATGALCSASNAYAEETRQTSSPDGAITLTVTYTDDNSLQYSIAKNSREYVKPSALGLTIGAMKLRTFPNGAEWTEASNDEYYALPHGKVSVAHNHYNELTVTGKGTASSRNLTVRFRVFDDGVAFRYEIPNLPGMSLTQEHTEFNIASFTRTWVQNYGEGYSSYYNTHTWNNLTNEGGYCGPMLIQSGAQYILLSEAGLFDQMAGSRIFPGETQGQIIYQPEGSSKIKSDFTSAWRTLQMGTLPTIVESTMIQNLVPDTEMTDWEEWVKPGASSWDWGSEDGSNDVTLDRCKSYIDLASSMGWPYFLLDEGWDGRVSLTDVTSYADSKNVKVLLWSHQNRFNNDYDNDYRILKGWADAGIAGVKIDFFNGDAQTVQEKYQVLLQACADCRLMVNFHGCNKPSGLERYWPHLMTTEANYGGEMYMNWGHLTPASHGVNLALTRNVIGPMDYTPVKYGKRDGCAIANTSWAYQTALTVLYESAHLTICDCASNLLGRESTPLLRQVPTTWDDIKCLAASPESYVTIARRSGDDWWVASVSDKARTQTIDLSFLEGDGTYYAYIYTQGVHATDIAFEKREVTSASRLSLSLKAQDGAVMCISPRSDLLYPRTIRREAENYAQGVNAEGNSWCSQGRQAGVMNNSSQSVFFDDIEVEEDGEYTLTFFYTNNEQSTAAISVNGASATYHTFNRQGGQSSHDPLGFTTIRVNLKKGNNTIKISPRNNANTPAFDRILLMTEVTDDYVESGVETVNSYYAPTITASAGTVTVTTAEAGELTIFTLDGRIAGTYSLTGGVNTIETSLSGIVIANVHCGSASFSKKLAL